MSIEASSGKHITLEALTEAHVPLVLTACQDWQDLARFGPPYWRPRSSAELKRKIAATSGPAVAAEYNFIIRDGQRLVGECSLHTIDWRNRVAQVGICVWSPTDRRCSLGVNAASELMTWADDHLDLQRLEAWILASNAPSLAFFEALGFAREGRLRGRYVLAGRRHDVEVLGRLVDAARS